MFRIKICGITSVEDGKMATQLGADAIGLNFYPKSPRYISIETAQDIIKAIPDGIAKVGLFVNAKPEEVCDTFDQLGIDLIQLHGDEPPEYLTKLGKRPIIRAFRVGEAGLSPVLEYCQQCRTLGCLPHLVLLDAHSKGLYGGTGQRTDWSLAIAYRKNTTHPPLVLAGGLTEENVAEAIQTVQPVAVDTASGVESSPGRKDSHRTEQFILAAQTAFSS